MAQVLDPPTRYTKVLQRAVTPVAPLPGIVNSYLLTCGPPDAAAVARANAIRAPPGAAPITGPGTEDIPAPEARRLGVFGFGGGMFGWGGFGEDDDEGANDVLVRRRSCCCASAAATAAVLAADGQRSDSWCHLN